MLDTPIASFDRLDAATMIAIGQSAYPVRGDIEQRSRSLAGALECLSALIATAESDAYDREGLGYLVDCVTRDAVAVHGMVGSALFPDRPEPA